MASTTTSAPIRARPSRRGRESLSMSRRARSMASAAAVPAPGTWLRRGDAVRSRGSPSAVGAAGPAGPSPRVVVIALLLRPGTAMVAAPGAGPRSISSHSRPGWPDPGRTSKDPRRSPGEGPGSFVALRLARPPRPSSLLPGAGNQANKAQKEEDDALQQARRGLGPKLVEGHMDLATIARHHDGDGAAILPVEEAHACSGCCGPPRRGEFGKCSRDRRSVNGTGWDDGPGRYRTASGIHGAAP